MMTRTEMLTSIESLTAEIELCQREMSKTPKTEISFKDLAMYEGRMNLAMRLRLDMILVAMDAGISKEELMEITWR